MEEEESERSKLVSLWHTTLKKGTDFDVWGQPVEAIETYTRLCNNLKEEIKVDDGFFTDQQKKLLGKVVTCLDMRCKTLQNPNRIEGISLEDMKQVDLRLQHLLSSTWRDFPIDVTGIQVSMKTVEDVEGVSANSSRASRLSELMEEPETIDDVSEQKARGRLLPALDPIPNKTLITIRVEKIYLKDASQLIDPFITLSVKDNQGTDLCPTQDTPVAALKDDDCITFGSDVHIPVPLEDLPNDFAIFYELKHYKPKKQITSIKCWSFMERDEIKEEQLVIEIYKKPTDFKRKKINLLTVKPLYLHIKLIFNT